MPLVIRLTGTNEEAALKILADIGLSAMSDMDAAVSTPVALAKGGSRVSIFIDKDTRLVVQGITGRDGSFHTRQMIEYGTQRRGRRHAGQRRPEVRGSPNGRRHGADLQHGRRGREGDRANATVIYVPPPFAADAIMEAAASGVSSSSASPKAFRCST